MNITTKIIENARSFPERKAVVLPKNSRGLQLFLHEHVTYEQFLKYSISLSKSLRDLNIKKGDKVLLFVKPAIELPILVFSLFSVGAVPVMIDPGIGRKRLLRAIKEVSPEVIIAEPVVHFLKLVFRSYFKSIKTSICTNNSIFFCNKNMTIRRLIRKNLHGKIKEYSQTEIKPNDTAIITYTSGSTGTPKGVVYTHEMLLRQLDILHKLIPKSFSVDLSCFPLFALFSLGMGKTSVIPVMDVTKPADVNPQFIVQHIFDNGISMATGSPAIWMRVADYCLENNIKINSLRGILMFGAPVPNWLHEKLNEVVPNGDTYTPYGATEALPVSWICGSEILKKHKDKTDRGMGVCVGKAVSGTTIKIIKNYDTNHIYHAKKIHAASVHEVGEVAVLGSQVTQSYYKNESADRAAKISDESLLWHRMGDLGYLDSEDNLWFCGRKKHYVDWKNRRLFSVMVEAIFNQHKSVKRSALISIPRSVGIVIERWDKSNYLSKSDREIFLNELISLAEKNTVTFGIKTFFLHKSFPVDCRHNIKINRELLSYNFSKKLDLAL